MPETPDVAEVPAVQQAIRALKSAIDSPSFTPPMMPAIAQLALSVASNRNVDLAELGRTIEGDQVLAARFLAVANSPIYRRKVATTTVTTAIARLGLTNARDLLFFTAVEPVLFTSKKYAAEMTALRQHSLGTAAASGYLARLRGFSLEYATLAGLVHDLGATAVLQRIAERDEEFKALRAIPGGLAAAIFATHTQAGHRIAVRWSLPEQVARALTEHHEVTHETPYIVILTAAADELATLAGIGSGLEPVKGHDALDRLLVDPEAVSVAITEFTAQVNDFGDEAS